jgi:hypothetical protein
VPQGECLSYVDNEHHVFAMEVCATGGMFEVCS